MKGGTDVSVEWENMTNVHKSKLSDFIDLNVI